MDINNLIQIFDFGNEQHKVEIKTLKATSLNKIGHIKLLNNHILPLLKIEESENKLDDVPMEINPADIATRIANPIKLVNNSLWWNGPNFFITEQLEIPNQDNFMTIGDTEKQNDVVTVTIVEEKIGGGIGEVIGCSKFGLLENLLRVTCFVRQFVLNLKAKQIWNQGLQGSLLVVEMANSEVLWLRYEQHIVVQGDTFEKVKHLLNFFDASCCVQKQDIVNLIN